MEDYIIIDSIYKSDLIKEVNAYLSRGYLLAGGVSTSSTSPLGRYMQAVYKPKIVKDDKIKID